MGQMQHGVGMEGDASTPIRVTVRLTRDVKSFRDLKAVVDAIDRLESKGRRLLRYEDEGPPRKKLGGQGIQPGRARLVRFRVDSPPLFEVLTDPDWLSLFLLMLVSYKTGRESVALLIEDAGRLVERIKGLTRRQRDQLIEALTRLEAEMLKNGAQAARKLADELDRIRKKLTESGPDMPDMPDMPEMSVDEDDDQSDLFAR